MPLVPVSANVRNLYSLPDWRITHEPDPSYLQILKASFQQYNPVTSWNQTQAKYSSILQTFWHGSPKDYDAFQDIPDHLLDYANSYLFARSKTDVDTISKQLERSLANDDILNRGGWTGTGAIILASLTDPIQFMIPATAFYKYAKAGTLASKIMAGAAFGTAATAASEPFLQLGVPTRTAGQASAEILTAGILSGLLFGVFGKNLGKEGQAAIRDAKADIADIISPEIRQLPAPVRPLLLTYKKKTPGMEPLVETERISYYQKEIEKIRKRRDKLIKGMTVENAKDIAKQVKDINRNIGFIQRIHIGEPVTPDPRRYMVPLEYNGQRFFVSARFAEQVGNWTTSGGYLVDVIKRDDFIKQVFGIVDHYGDPYGEEALNIIYPLSKGMPGSKEIKYTRSKGVLIPTPGIIGKGGSEPF